VHVGKLTVVEGRLGFEDRARARPFSAAIAPLQFSLTDFRTDVGHRSVYSFAGATRAGEKLEWTGAFTVQPVGASGTFSVADLRLATLAGYLDDKLRVKLASGTVGLHGSYEFRLQPLSLEVALPSINVRDLSLAERGAAGSASVVVPEIDAQNVGVSLSRRDVGLQRLDVRGARIDVSREQDGGISLARLAQGPGSPAQPPGTPSAPWTLHADVISVDGARVVAEDRTTSPAVRLELAPIAVTISDWTTAPGARMKLDARIGIDRRGELSARGDVALQPLNAALAIDLQAFPLPALQPYLAQATAMTLHSGRLGAKGNLSFAAPAATTFSGEVRIDDVRATDRVLREDFLKWRTLVVTGIQFQQNPDRMRIDRIVARNPYARVIIAEDGSVNIAQVLAPRASKQADAPKAPAAGASAPFPIAIRTLQVIDGSANFTDFAVRPSFATGIEGLSGEIKGLSSAPTSRAAVALTGRVDEYSPVELTGEVNLLSAELYTRLALNFRNIELTKFNPYSGKFAGYSIVRGKLSTKTKYQVEARKLEAQHHIVVDNLEFGDRTESKDAAPIPIKLGVALLKDKRGVIEVDLPVSGTLDDPEFRLAPLIWKGVVGLLTKIVSAPFKALGEMFGGGGEELAFVDFQPGSAVLSAAANQNLTRLATGLVERPELRLNVPLAVASAADGEVVANQALQALVLPVDPAKPFDDVAKRKRLDALEGAYLARLKIKPAYPEEAQGPKDPNLDARIGWVQTALLDHLRPTPAALEALGQQRAGAVRAALLVNKDLSAERIFIVSKPMEAASPTGSVRMEMKLE
jgi:hypothetical protein